MECYDPRDLSSSIFAELLQRKSRTILTMDYVIAFELFSDQAHILELEPQMSRRKWASRNPKDLHGILALR